MSNKEAMV